MSVITQGHIKAHYVIMSLIFHSANPVGPKKNLGLGCSLLQTLYNPTVLEQTFGFLIKLACKGREERLKCSMKKKKNYYGTRCSWPIKLV